MVFSHIIKKIIRWAVVNKIIVIQSCLTIGWCNYDYDHFFDVFPNEWNFSDNEVYTNDVFCMLIRPNCIYYTNITTKSNDHNTLQNIQAMSSTWSMNVIGLLSDGPDLNAALRNTGCLTTTIYRVDNVQWKLWCFQMRPQR